MSDATTCPTCSGAGTMQDNDPHADLRGLVTCKTCGGAKSIPQDDTPKGVRYIGRCHHSGKAEAAIVDRFVDRPVLARVYKNLAPDARLQVTLAKRWNVWGVLATDEWAERNRKLVVPPSE